MPVSALCECLVSVEKKGLDLLDPELYGYHVGAETGTQVRHINRKWSCHCTIFLFISFFICLLYRIFFSLYIE